MAKQFKIGKNEKRILDALAINPNSSVKRICFLLYGEEVELRSSKYNSIVRSLTNLEHKGLVEKGNWILRYQAPFPEHLKKMWMGMRSFEKDSIRDEIHDEMKAVDKIRDQIADEMNALSKTMTKLMNLP